MKARFSLPLLFLVPCLMLAALIGLAFAAGSAGVAWIFIYGDNTWPESAGSVIMGLAGIAALATLMGSLAASYSYGKFLETMQGLMAWHVVAAGGLTIAVLALGLLIIK